MPTRVPTLVPALARSGPRLLAALAAALTTASALAGCASSSIQTDAAAFVSEHAGIATSAASAMRTVEHAVSQLSSPPTGQQLERLSHAASRARASTVRASEWDVSKSGEGGEEGAEEENLPRAESEATSAASELASSMLTLQAYARAPSAAGLARYRSALAGAREKWDESISQLWFLAHRHDPPTV